MRYQSYLIGANQTLFEAMATLETLKKKIVYVINEDQVLVGSITDGDVRRFALQNHTFVGLAKDVMKSPCFFGTTKKEVKAILALHQLTSVPIVDGLGRVIDILFDEVIVTNEVISDSYANTKVVMMAGGRGDRLYPYTAVLPKPLIPIAGIPIGQRILERFAMVGLKEYILSLNYKKNIIKAYFDEAMDGCRFDYIEEEVPMGTAGSLALMKDLLSSDFFVINCDMLIDIDLVDFIRYHKEQGNAISVVSSLKAITVPYGVFDLNEQGEVCQLKEKPTINQFINTGMYLVRRDLVDLIPRDREFHMTELMQACLSREEKVGAYIVNDDAFMDMGQMDELSQMQAKLRP